ncbi:MAG: hypothetical protein ACPLZH_00640, partial [Minisyncoccales bacterium]
MEEEKIKSEEDKKEVGEKESFNFLPLLSFFLFLIVIFQFFYIISLKKKMATTVGTWATNSSQE